MVRSSKWVCAALATAALAVVVGVEVQAAAYVPGDTSVKQLDISLKPNYGEVKLKTGFPKDPTVVNVTAGGNLKVVHKGVTSHVTKQPDFKLHFQTDGKLPLTIYTESKGDTTLLINLPDGTWIADDDGGKGLNAQIKINNPKSGRYDIYVGTFKPNLESQVKLMITELK